MTMTSKSIYVTTLAIKCHIVDKLEQQTTDKSLNIMQLYYYISRYYSATCISNKFRCHTGLITTMQFTSEHHHMAITSHLRVITHGLF